MENFSTLNLREELKRAVKDLGYEKPSPIQAQALPILLGEPTDFIGLAATGTGKTAAFSLPMLEKLNPADKFVQALIICPTRELCLQVSGQINLLGKHLKIHALPIYGGASYDDQIRGLRSGAQIVVGTPGRLIDHLERGRLNLKQLKVLILDEADEMISMGFREDIEAILEQAPEENCNTWLFSATMSPSVRKVADQFLTKPKIVQVNRGEMLSSTVEQYFYMTQEKNKPEVLCKLVDAAEDFYGVVFCQTKMLVVDLTRYLTERGYRADSLHGDKSQAARELTLKDFRSRRIKILVCTDVAARGLDVKDVTHVINYSLPRELDSYVHRIGRTARSGKNGIAMSLVTPSHSHLLKKIQNLTKVKILEGVIPSRKALAVKKVSQLLGKFGDQVHFARAVELLDDAWKASFEKMSKEEIVGRFLTMQFPEVFAESLQRPPMSRTAPEKAASSDQGRRPQRDRPQRDRPENGAKKRWRPSEYNNQNNKRVNGNYPPRRP